MEIQEHSMELETQWQIFKVLTCTNNSRNPVLANKVAVSIIWEVVSNFKKSIKNYTQRCSVK